MKTHIRFGLVVAIAYFGLSGIAQGDNDKPRSAVRLSVDQDGGLSGQQIDMAIAQVREIWSDVGVAVVSGRYGDRANGAETTISLRILQSPAPKLPESERVLAWMIEGERGHPVPLLFVSLPAVTDTVLRAKASGRPVKSLTRTLQDHAIARAIGRVTAHELGHYLLQDAHHRGIGLMCAHYSPSDLVDQWIEPFRIPAAERAMIREKVAALTHLR